VRVSWEVFAEAADGCGVPDPVRDALWRRLAGQPPADGLALRTVAQRGGAALCLVALGLFLGTSWASAGSGTGLVLVLVYLAGLTVVCEVLHGRGHREAAGLLAVTVVVLVPLAVLAAQGTFSIWDSPTLGHYRSFLDYLHGPSLTVEVLTGAVAVGLWRRYRAPFLLLPVGLVGWAAAADLVGALGGDPGGPAVHAAVAVLLTGLALLLDVQQRREEAAWLHLPALAAVGATVACLPVGDGTKALLLGLAGLAAVAAAVRLGSRLHLAAGALGLFASLSYFAFEVFGGSPTFALVLGALGVGVVVAGVRLDRAVSSTG
jgi:hypothetical protein